jgi:hypothetical protein
MQRGSAVELGGLSVVLDDHDIKEWHLTGLSLRKFRDTLNRVTSCFASTRGLGLGLTALEFQHVNKERRTYGTIVGAEVLGNIVSSANHRDYLLLSAGANITYNEYVDHSNAGVNIPFGAESLWTIDPLMKWQWRNTAVFNRSMRDENGHELSLSSSISRRLGEFMGSEIVSGLSVRYRRGYEGDIISSDRETLIGQLQLEINRW